jgi:hypothetical protein
MKSKGLILTGVGFFVGFFEALAYYNLGQAQGKGYKFKIPPNKELFKTAAMVLVTSLATTALFSAIELMMPEEEKEAKQS